MVTSLPWAQCKWSMTTAFHKSWKDSFSQSQLCPLFSCSSANMNKCLHVWIFVLMHSCSMLDRNFQWKPNVNGGIALERHFLSSPDKFWDEPKLPVRHPSRAGMVAGSHVPQCRQTVPRGGSAFGANINYCFSVMLMSYSRMELLVLPCHLYGSHLQLWELHSSPWLRMFYSWSVYGKTKHGELWWYWNSFAC